MKSLIILPFLALISIAAHSQSSTLMQGIPNANPTVALRETTVEENKEIIQIKYKEESVSDRREFFAPSKMDFDPSADYDQIYAKSATNVMIKKTEKGVAKVMNNNDRVQIAYFNNASIGTILRVVNPDNGKMIYAIVVGKIPPAISSSYMIMLSDWAARKLSMKDYSSVELSYYIPNTTN